MTALIIAVYVLLITLTALIFIFLSLKHGVKEIDRQLPEILQGGTNRLITVSGDDGSLKKLAVRLNESLSTLREKELKYENGDREIKTALSNAAHDFRTPLTAINGYLDLLENEADGEKREKYLRVIRERTDTLTKLSEELFSYSVAVCANRRKAEKLDACAVLKETIADFYEAFRAKNITPEIRADGQCETVADRTELARMFSNLISNALKYSAGSFSVTLEGRTFTFENDAENVDCIDVNRLFDRFYTVKNGRNSTGLGLSIAKLVCERLGGKIGAELHGNRLKIILTI